MSGELGSDATTARKLWRGDTEQEKPAYINVLEQRFDLLAGLVVALIATRPALHGHPARERGRVGRTPRQQCDSANFRKSPISPRQNFVENALIRLRDARGRNPRGQQGTAQRV